MMFGGVMGLFWIAVLVGGIFLIKGLIQPSRVEESRSEKSALEIIKRRYARGEISRDDFKKLKKDVE